MAGKDEKKPEGETIEHEEENQDHELDSKINVAVRAQMQRALKPIHEQLKGIDKSVADSVAKAFETFAAKPADDKKSKEEGGKADPQVKLLQEKLEALQKKQQESEERAQHLEKTSRQKETRSLMRDALDAKGVKGTRANALIALFESSGMLREDEEGKPVLAVIRSRSRGASPEELEFDISEGIEDWAKTQEAGDFIPAPGKSANERTTPQARPAPRTAPKQYEKQPVSDAESVRRTVEQLGGYENVSAILSGE